MRSRPRQPRIIAFVLLALGVVACADGGSNPSVVRVALPAPPTATGTVDIKFPPAALARAARQRRDPAYVSVDTGHAALFIDGATTASGSTTTCTPASCTISWSTTLAVPASHTFAVEIDTGSTGGPPTFTVLAENSAPYVIHAGVNTLATLTLNGVAGSAALSGETCTTSTCSGTLTIEDAAGDPITSPGAVFDNPPVTVSSSAATTGKITTPAAPITAVTANGQYPYTATCQVATGTFLINVTAGTASNDVTAAELAGLSPAVSYPSTTLPLAQITPTYICRAADAMMKVIFLTAPVTTLSTFTVPSDWASGANSIEVISGGGGGDGKNSFGGGGGGGAYSKVTNQVITGTVDYEIGAGGTAGSNAAGGAGGNTWFCKATATCTTDAAANVIVAAKGGTGGANNSGGAGGTVVKGAGNAGGAGGATATTSASAGGGAGGPNGIGGTGGDQGSNTTTGAGGGGNGGGAAGKAGSATSTGAGGNNSAGAGGGAAGNPGAAGTVGGGGGGGTGAAGGAGGPGIEWSALFGGGGGGGASNAGLGGDGGTYGGGGGGSNSTGGSGGDGLIVIIYTP